MSEVSPVGDVQLGRIDAESRVTRSRTEVTSEARADRASDRVDVSPVARYLNRLNDLPEIRESLVSRIREQIEAGSYETPERLSSAIDQLIDESL
jgi:anti-sigma28 factor (negative regulator of flagellin synthesis)